MTPRVKAGTIYKQKNSQFWWVQYYVPGRPKPVRESTKTTDKEEAQRFLWQRLGEVATGRFNGLEQGRVRVDQLFDMLEEDYEINGRASLKQLRDRLRAHLRPFFGGLKASDVGTAHLSAYIAKRKREGKKNATINRELEHLRRAFTLGYEAEPQLVSRPLRYRKLTEDNVREGLVSHDQYLTLRAGLPEPYRTFFVCGYHLGTRRGELGKIKWSQVDFARGEITIERYTTKTKQPRVLPIYGDMREYLQATKDLRDRLYPECPWVFQRKGKKFIYNERSWRGLVERLACPGILFHDLRRTALTNMMDAGFSEKEAMAISGHTTDRTFRRYHIIRRDRVQALGKKMEDFYAGVEGRKVQATTTVQ